MIYNIYILSKNNFFILIQIMIDLSKYLGLLQIRLELTRRKYIVYINNVKSFWKK